MQQPAGPAFASAQAWHDWQVPPPYRGGQGKVRFCKHWQFPLPVRPRLGGPCQRLLDHLLLCLLLLSFTPGSRMLDACYGETPCAGCPVEAPPSIEHAEKPSARRGGAPTRPPSAQICVAEDLLQRLLVETLKSILEANLRRRRRAAGRKTYEWWTWGGRHPWGRTRRPRPGRREGRSNGAWLLQSFWKFRLWGSDQNKSRKRNSSGLKSLSEKSI